ncbi:hypothetical protein [Mucilaginibacter sp.]|jgi:hypothetical protein|uniref:hypothetical protein n=1 Tax=Mucilaginibacter sp. TaxID=1882438 RepID=UPI00261090D7|nr:hypothetical protein [Mucilaginibacter sp.]MDB4920059.1 hypothetical protein [Mucilaginibacter sp.]
MEILNVNIAEVVKRECAFDCTISPHPGQVVVQISNDDFARRMGNLILQLQKVIDRHYPEREENLFLVIRAPNEKENVFKIWKSV